ncbi:hypothetical protein [Corynebacterium macginleyi]|uniref:Uncharacterized protein n=1 Tax=Corynebacterium macginleyi TaxID=38290 RepID=A0ABS1Y8B8_9CORY|nr:hypothetical protein [Corynebacterium macginleyi]MBM0244637.1 hypothetical protein [Corynebacterium macginleyi]MBM0261292.1 hypothetical protein [Corynebacterium macginleyi]QRJ59607.1 hypothetical protein GWO70_009035 [Corynebacterium macginleyi]
MLYKNRSGTQAILVVNALSRTWDFPNYLSEVKAQIRSGHTTLGEIVSEADLEKSFEENAVPDSLFETTVENFEDFLIERRSLMAKKMKEYYFSL